MDRLNIKVIVGSSRPNRFSEQPARWIFEEAKKREALDVELLDLRDYPMPFFEEALPPGLAKDNYTDEVVVKWRAKITEADGFIIATPEYNHGYPAVLKNAMDYVYSPWSRKAVSFVSWGGLGGARSVEQLRQVAVELDMAPVRFAVHIANFWSMLDKDGQMNFDPFQKNGSDLLDHLTWWTRALKTGRSQS